MKNTFLIHFTQQQKHYYQQCAKKFNLITYNIRQNYCTSILNDENENTKQYSFIKETENHQKRESISLKIKSIFALIT